MTSANLEVEVVFATYCDLVTGRIFRTRDRYSPSTYAFATTIDVVASGGEE